jgi:hypothetical protein
MIDRLVGLQPVLVQPIEVEHQQLAQLVERQARLGLRWQPLGHERHRGLDLVHRAWRHRVQTPRLAAHRDCGDHEHRDRRQHDEEDGDA